jgi:AraC-like DNA-binding protein
MIKPDIFESSLKKIGLVPVTTESVGDINGEAYKSYIKALYVPAGYRLKIDFNLYTTTGPSVFFIAPNQYLQIEEMGDAAGHFVFYNRDFYCIQIHDEEVSCDGLLFNNIQNMPMISLAEQDAAFVNYLFEQMKDEFRLGDRSLEEMIRTYLKQLLIKATRLWKQQHLDKTINEQHTDLEFFRKFTILVDAHYKTKHAVSDYADMLFIAAKTITHKFKRLNLPQPNDVIKNRIVLEAKRLLVHTSMTAKEIAYHLGYEDPAYFSRLFLTQTGDSPSAFKAKFLAAAES